MKYYKEIKLKDGRACVLRGATEDDAAEVLRVFILTHGQTDNLLSYPDEITFGIEEEAAFLKKRAESPDETEIVAFVDGRAAGTAGIDRVGKCRKVRHRA
ncbi:MAG: GNAT family N-acetyltransferase, partial [Clostridia bacterium]|nr:GNAT family N-acetyltransferase [Clostridia bacterium]